MENINRRSFLKAGMAAAVLSGIYGCTQGKKASGHVVVVGGGYGGATAARYLRSWSEGQVQVTLVERSPQFISCPLSNLVLDGSKDLDAITVSYDNLKNRWGVRVIQDEVTGLDTNARTLKLATGNTLTYDRLVLSPGVEFMWERIPGLKSEQAQAQILHAWHAGPQTIALRKQLESMPDGGVFAMTIPKAPYRSPPGPYERACLVANYFKKAKPRSKVLILDANDDIQSKKPLFTKAWTELYPGMIEYRPDSTLQDVHAASRTAILEFERVKADVLNVIPPQRAGSIAAESGLKLINNRWVDVDWLSLQSRNAPDVHVLGDAVFPAPTMPKSGHMANQHAKVAVAAILNSLAGREPSQTPVLMNTCYSFVDSTNAVHAAFVHQYDRTTQTMQPVKGAGGLSSAHSELEGQIAFGWAENIWADMLA